MQNAVAKIDLQDIHSRTTNRRQPDENRSVPFEVVTPMILPGMKETRHFA